MRRLLAGGLFVLFTALSAQAAAPLLAKLKEVMAKTADLSAAFRQVTTLEAAGVEKETKGRALFKRGGRMRWEYEGDDPQLIVSDGQTLWVYQVRDRTVFRRALSELTPSSRAALDLLEGAAALEANFSITSCGPECLLLKPQSPDPDLASVKLELSPSGESLKALTTEDLVGNLTRIELSDLKRNQGIPDSSFNFTVPKGVDVFDEKGRLK